MMFRIANHHISRRVSLLLLAEIVVFILSVYAGAKIRFLNEADVFSQFDNFFMSACLFAFAMVMSMCALGLYQIQFNDRFRATVLRLMPSFALGFCLVVVTFYIAPGFGFGRGILGLVFAFASIGVLMTRFVFVKTSQLDLFESRVLFLGCGQLAKACSDVATSNTTTHKYDVVGFVNAGLEEASVSLETILPKESSLLGTVRKHNVAEVVVAVQNRREGRLPIQELLECKLNGIRVTDSAAFFEREACQIRVDSLLPSWLVFGSGFDQSSIRLFVKRAFDLLASLILAIVVSPITLLTALIIYCEDRGPIFYRQERVGKDGRTYKVLKFRSMRNDAERAGKPQWATKNDPRTTRIGTIIRKLRIDEIPQIFNVIKGEMSFVGPRPERPYFVEQLREQIPYYDVRHSIKPGITGMAQVRYPYGASVEDSVQKLQYDLYYVKNNSLFLDILILIDTIQVVLLGKGAR